MYSNNDPKIHRDYVERFIAGKRRKREVIPAPWYTNHG